MAVGEEQPTLAIVMQMLEQQQKQFKQLETRLESKAARSSARHDDSESDGYGSDASARSERSYGSSNSSATNLSDYEFVPVRDSNPHWGSRALAASCDDEPKRHELYGNKTFDQLCGGRHEGGGALGWSFEYAEAISLHQYSANDDLRELLEQLPRDDPLRDRLGSLLRTNGGGSSRGRGRGDAGGDRRGGGSRGGGGARRDAAGETSRGGASRRERRDRRDAGSDDGASSSGESF